MSEAFEPVTIIFKSRNGDRHHKGAPTRIDGTEVQRTLHGHGDDFALNGLTVYASLRRQGSTLTNTAAYKQWRVTGFASGVISGSIPHTGIGWTGASQLRLFYTAGTSSVRHFLGHAIDIKVVDLGDQWVP